MNFSERGNFYVEGSQVGLGTANVRSFTDNINARPDKFMIYGGLRDDIFIDDKQFNISYKYDKALYIEKTGFDAVFKAERLDEKYNLLIVSGQGFASRAARRLLYNLQEQGLKLFCMHDLDISGVTIFNSMRQANDKFDYDLDMIDMGVTPNDVIQCGIVPEKTDKVDSTTLDKLSREYRPFFEGVGSSRRVELNAFSTEQLLKLIDNKLSGINNLPAINLSKSLELDNQALREVAFMRIIKDKYAEQLAGINLDCDLSKYDGILTLPEAKYKIPYIKEDLINQYVEAIKQQVVI